MGSKVKCPGCGAKNDVANRRCRICTAVINLDAPGPEAAASAASPAVPSVMADHFDAGEINRQIQPARARFATGPSGLGARIAAANGGQIPVRPSVPSTPSRDTSGDTAPPPTFDPLVGFGSGPAQRSELAAPPSAPTAAPIEYEEEPFDPDALFRDLG
jgi:hypothetical protein